MVMYPSGGNPGGPFPWEIDETGYGAWTLYDHSTHLPADEAKQYLKDVFLAIARAADWLWGCSLDRFGIRWMFNCYEPAPS